MLAEGAPPRLGISKSPDPPSRGEGGVSPETLKNLVSDLHIILTKPYKISLKDKEVPEIMGLIIVKLVKSIKIAEKLIENGPRSTLSVLGYLAQVLNSACGSKLRSDLLAEKVKEL